MHFSFNGVPSMSMVDQDGMFDNPGIVRQRFAHIEHGNLEQVHALVIHQTDSDTIESTLNAYRTGGNGAHFLIARNGAIHQTASVLKRCYHVGRLIRSRCLELRSTSCADAATAKALTLGWSARIREIDRIERQKDYPERFPVNSDSIGIEIVGMHVDETSYEAVSLQQGNSLLWLLDLLYEHFSLGKDDVFRHPAVSYKHPGEAASAKWR